MASKALSPEDPSSYSRPDLCRIKYMSINWTIDFPKRIIRGNVDLALEKLVSNISEVILDSKDLKISKVVDSRTGKPIGYSLGKPIGEFGQALTLKIPEKQLEYQISIFYETSPKASGLQWLEPEQTATKTFPYLFSQFQAIHARSALPCQDTPSVKHPYKATVSVTAPFTVLMSAIPKSSKTLSSDEKQFKFEQTVPIPSYLIAIAVGFLESRKVGPRTNVWCEPILLEDCAYEFAETEKQLKVAEKICGSYVWGIYDILVLPPSFPFGGMENPCLTFVTPTLLAGDRSLANVIAHEIAHSWTGNLVTNKNFEHFWLNEGFTVFVERKIKMKLTSKAAADFDAYVRLSDLEEAIQVLGPSNKLTQLVVDLHTDGTHPDDAFSIVPYEKGHTFLRYLEQLVGGPTQFEPFFRSYLDKFKFESISTAEFKSFFESYFHDDPEIKRIAWDDWLHSPGMPSQLPHYDTSLAKQCDSIINEIIDWNESNKRCPVDAIDIQNLTVDQRIYILQQFLAAEKISVQKLGQIDLIFTFSTTSNAEIKFRWFRLGIKSHWHEIVVPAMMWINDIGRMKYVRPLYRDLYEWEDVRKQAQSNFEENKKYMMHVVAYTVAKDLHLSV